MGYYRGDYYRGDYYRGDLRGMFDTVLQLGATAAGTAFGGPLGGVTAGAIAGAILKRPPMAMGAAAPGPMMDMSPPGVAMVPAVMAGQQGVIRGTALEIATLHGNKRLHPNKTTYVTRGGGTSHWPKGLQVHVKGTTPVSHRRMNVGNTRALKKALRRAHGFVRIAMKTIHLINPKRKGRFGGFKTRRKAK